MTLQTVNIPLLRDHHSHPLLYAAFGRSLSLITVSSQDEAGQRIRQWTDDRRPDVTVVHGWRSNAFAWTDKELEAFQFPLAILNVSLHSLRLNQSGRQFLAEKYGSVVHQIDDTIWYENNLRVVLNWFAKLDASVEALQTFYDRLVELGIYYAEEMLLVDEDEIRLFDQAGLTDRTRFWADPGTFDALSEFGRQRVHGLKLFTDGAIGARTAAMNRPYRNGAEITQNCGLLIYSDVQLAQKVAFCLDTGKSLAIHAIGDRAIEQVVASLENSGEKIRQAPEIRIEHAQMINRNVARRAKQMGVHLSMQPNFSSDTVDYRDRLDAGYCELNNPFRMLIDEIGFIPGDDLVFGSDGMPHGVETAIQQSMFPSIPQQELTLDEFVAGYCMNPEQPGSIELTIENDRVVTKVAPPN